MAETQNGQVSKSYKMWRSCEIDEPVIRIGGEVPIKIQSMINFPTEVSALAICERDPLNVVDLLIPKQECSIGSTLMDDDDVADETVRLAREGVQPVMCNRVWIHTHPGNSPNPSGKDWETFTHLIDSGGWAVMLIFAKDSSFFCRLGFKMGDGHGISKIPVHFSMSKWHHPETTEEIKRKVTKETWTTPKWDYEEWKKRRGDTETRGQKKDWTDDMYDTEYSRSIR